MRTPLRVPRRAMTLIELLVVMAIIGILVAMLLPAVQSARESSRRASCSNHLKQIGLALHMYHDAQRWLPPGWIGVDFASEKPHASGESGWGWASMVLPYLEEGNLAQQEVDFDHPVRAPRNQSGREHLLSVFLCPSDPSEKKTFELRSEADGSVLTELAVANYVAMFGTEEVDECAELPVGEPCRSDGPFFHNSHVNFALVLDGLSQTIFVGERHTFRPRAERWQSTWTGAVPDGEETFARIVGVADHTPNHPDTHFEDYSSHHPGGANFLLGDGSVRFISEMIDEATYQALATIRDGDLVGTVP